jgi:hypothetical protein
MSKSNEEFVTQGAINIEALESSFADILSDAVKSNKGNGAAGRRFRLSTVAISKSFLDMRKVTAKK